MIDDRPSLQLVILETTTRCNLKCIHWWSSKENSLGKYDDLDFPMDLFGRVLPLLQEFRPMVQLNGDGETLLNPNILEVLEKMTRMGGFRDIIQEGQNGFLFEENNTPEAIQKMEILFKNVSGRDCVISNRRLTVEAAYSPEWVVRRCMGVPSDLVRNNPKRMPS